MIGQIPIYQANSKSITYESIALSEFEDETEDEGESEGQGISMGCNKTEISC